MAASKLVLEGRVSISAFLAGLSVIFIPLIRTWFGHVDLVFDYLTESPGKVAICLQVLVVNGLLLLLYRGPVYKVRLWGVRGQRVQSGRRSSPGEGLCEHVEPNRKWAVSQSKWCSGLVLIRLKDLITSSPSRCCEWRQPINHHLIDTDQ